jgi:PAS domain S-box-containing protein
MEGKNTRREDLRARIIDVEKKLIESKRRFSQSIENSPSPIFSVDRSGTVKMWNQSYEDVFGYAKEAPNIQSILNSLRTSHSAPSDFR